MNKVSLISLHARLCSLLLLSSGDFFQNKIVQEFFRTTIRVSNGLNLEKMTKSPLAMKELNFE